MGTVYALSLDGETYRYVGITKRPLAARLYHHRWYALNGKGNVGACQRWIRKYNGEIVATVLAEVRDDELKLAEQWWISRLRSEGFDLLNLTAGGDGSWGWTPSEETRRKIGEANRKQKGRPATRVYGAPANKGKPMSDEQKAKLRAAALGRKLTPEHRAAIGASLMGNTNRRQVSS